MAHPAGRCPACGRRGHCDATARVHDRDAGRVVQCPTCRDRFTAPNLALAPQHVELVGSGPVNVVVAPHPKRERLNSGGWFTRSLGVAGAMALVAFVFVLAVAASAYWFVKYQVNKAASSLTGAIEQSLEETTKRLDEQAKQETAARQFAGNTLKKHGVAELSTTATVRRIGDIVVVSGSGLGADGKLKPCSVVYREAQFSKAKRLELLRATVDGAAVYGGDNAEAATYEQVAR